MLLMPVMGVESILTVYGMSRIVIIYVAISRTFMIVCTIPTRYTYKRHCI